MVYGLALSWYALKSGHLAHRDVGLFAVAASICAVAVAGASYEPIGEFRPIVNIRAGAFAAEMIGLLILLTWSKGPGRGSWPSWSHGALLAVFCLLIFMLCTVETRDYFGKILGDMRQASASSVLGDRLELELRKYSNLQQVSLSLVWLVYSIALVGYGIWRRILSLRIIAIVIFGIAILKIFIYDLSFLETLYRIFSFIGLGLILLSVSFLYQRFKSAIFEAGPQAEVES